MVQLKQKRTRKRVPVSCRMCRHKKIKCDKKRPFCTNCLLNGTSGKCHYAVQCKSKIEKGASEQDIIQKEANEIYLNDIKSVDVLVNDINGDQVDELADLPGYCKVNYSEKFSSTIAQEIDDITISFAGKGNCIVAKEWNYLYFGPTNFVSIIVNHSSCFRLYKDYLELEAEKIKDPYVDPILVERESSIALKLTKKEDIVKIIHRMIPDFDIVSIFVDRFFNICFDYAPVISKEDFMHSLNKIITVQNGKIATITCLTIDSLAIIAMLLIMLRFAYITLPIRSHFEKDTPSEQHELVNMTISRNINISSSFIELAERIIPKGSDARRTTLRLLQAKFLYRVYLQHAPELDYYWSDVSLSLGELIQISRHSGINNDPKKSFLASLDDPHSTRKIWSHILYMDALNSFIFGYPLMINDSDIDSNWPFSISGNDFDSSDRNEANILKSLKVKFEATKLMRKLVSSFCIRGEIKYKDVLDILEDVDLFLLREVKSFEQLINPENPLKGPSASNRTLEFMLRLKLTEMLLVSHFLVYSSSKGKIDDEGNLRHLISSLEYSFIIFRIGVQFVNDLSCLFGPELEVMIATSIFSSFIKVVPTIFSFILDSQSGKLQCSYLISKFKSVDSTGLQSWLGFDKFNQSLSLRKICSKFVEFNNKSMRLNSKFILLHKVTTITRSFISNLGLNYPFLFEQEDTFGGMHLEDFNKYNNSVNNFWNHVQSKPNLDFFSDSTILPDPFLNDTPLGLDLLLSDYYSS